MKKILILGIILLLIITTGCVNSGIDVEEVRKDLTRTYSGAYKHGYWNGMQDCRNGSYLPITISPNECVSFYGYNNITFTLKKDVTLNSCIVDKKEWDDYVESKRILEDKNEKISN